MERRNLANILASVLTVLCLASLLTPWWTADSHFTGSVPGGGNFDEHASLGARPFDGDGIISDGEALTAGLLALGATLAAAGAAALGWLRFRPMVPAALAAGAAALALVALVLALTTWPADEMSFWDSGSGGAMGMSMQVEVYANVGWYLAATAAVVGFAAAGFLAASASDPQRAAIQPEALPAAVPAAAAPAAPAHAAPPATMQAPAAAAPASGAAGSRCAATTKAGSQCARRATSGDRCAIHS